MENEKLAILWEQYLSGRMSRAERTELRTLLEDANNQDLLEILLNQSMDNPDIPLQKDGKKEKHIIQVLDAIRPSTTPTLNQPQIRTRSWFRYAAAATLVLCAGAYFLFRPTGKDMKTEQTTVAVHNIRPGGDRAMLTLADGSVILLDSAGNGSIALQGNTQIMKQADGRIVYGSGNSTSAASMTNTMRTPIGGKYQLVLPDGTKVWLNAASSITFPVAFPQKERSVTISGEAYFEVAQDKSRPFSVTGGNANVQVLGTHFNVNAYQDEEKLKVTLLNGSVKVLNIQSKQATILVPGQQAQLSAAQISSSGNIDMNKVMAWKNDLFNFEDVTLDEAMRQISRWYGVKVIYEQGIPKTQLWGKMSRNTSFERVLRNLKDIGVNYKLTDKKELIVLQ